MSDRGHGNPLGVAIGGCIALAAAMGIGRFAYTPILPFMVEGLGLSAEQAGILASVNFIGHLVGALFGAFASLPGGRRPWFLGSLATCALVTLAMGLTENMTVFLVLRFVGGVTTALVLVLSSALVLDRIAASGRLGLAAVHFAGVGLGIAFSAALIALLARFGADWSGLWLACGAVSLAVLALTARLVPGAPEAPPPVARKGGGLNIRLIAIITAYGLFGFGYVITATFINTIVRFSPAVSVLEPYVWFIVGIAAIPSVAAWGIVGRRIGNDRAFALACVVEAISVAASIFDTSPFAVVTAALLFGGTLMGITSLGLMLARTLSRGDPRRAMAMTTAAFGLGQTVGPTFAGYAHQMTGSFVLPSLVAAATLLVAALLAVPPARLFGWRA